MEECCGNDRLKSPCIAATFTRRDALIIINLGEEEEEDGALCFALDTIALDYRFLSKAKRGGKNGGVSLLKHGSFGFTPTPSVIPPGSRCHCVGEIISYTSRGVVVVSIAAVDRDSTRSRDFIFTRSSRDERERKKKRRGGRGGMNK